MNRPSGFEVNITKGPPPRNIDTKSYEPVDTRGIVKLFRDTEIEETREGIAARITQWWARGAVTAATMSSFAADPVMRPYLANAGLNIQALLPSRGYGNGKRKRSVKSSFAVGRGRKKGRR